MTNSDMLLTLLNAALEEDKLLRDELEESKAEAANERVGSAYLQECAMIERDALSKMLESTVKALDESRASNLEIVTNHEADSFMLAQVRHDYDELQAQLDELQAQLDEARGRVKRLESVLEPTADNITHTASWIAVSDENTYRTEEQCAARAIAAIRWRVGLPHNEKASGLPCD